MPRYTSATVEWADTSEHATVALRPGNDGQVSHVCAFANQKGMMIAVSAGLQEKKVDITTIGEAGGHWQNVHIVAVR